MTGSVLPTLEGTPAGDPGLTGQDEDLFRRMADLLPDVVYVHDIESNLNLYANRRAQDFVGLSQAEMDRLGPELLQRIIHPEDLPILLARRTDVRRQDGDGAVEFHCRLATADGGWRWVRSKERPFRRDADGRVIQVLGVISDIDALKRAEQQQRDAGERLRLAIETSNMVVFSQDARLRYDWIYNPALGYQEAEVVGKTDHDLMERAEDADALVAVKRAVLDTGEPLRRTVQVRQDGEAVWYDLNVRPQRDEAGGVVGVLACAKDITPLQRSLLDLKSSQDRFRTAQDLALDGFAILSVERDGDGAPRDFRCVYANPAAGRLLGRPMEAVVGARLMEALPTGGRKLLARCRRVLETGKADDAELLYEADGIDGWFRVACVPLGDGVAIQFSDISERKRHGRERQAALEKRALLLKELNHRIKNSLQLVGSLLRLQSGGIAEPAARAQFERACQRVTAIAEVHARLYMTEEVGTMDFGAYVQSAIPQSAALQPGGGAEVLVEEASGHLDVDRAIPLCLILNELVTNAVEHGAGPKGGGTVRVGFRAEGGEAFLYVQDDGTGAEPPLEEKLGLRLVRVLVGQLKGRLAVARTPGLRYELRVPMGG